jgi:predicted Rossmann fold flavoprotein
MPVGAGSFAPQGILDGMIKKAYDVIIVGAGPAGLMAALESHTPQRSTLIIEKMPAPALKLRISGKGRCNITNAAPLGEFISHFGTNGRFLKHAFHAFFSSDLIRYFETLGVSFKLERGGRYFPVNDSALDIVKAMLKKVTVENISMIKNTQVTAIEKSPEGYFQLTVKRRKSTPHANALLSQVISKKVVLAMGGKSYPKTGSDGSGYHLAAHLGHTIIPPIPSLVPVFTAGNLAARLEGLSLRNVSVRIIHNEKKIAEKFGEMVFTDTGLSGPVILSLSKRIVPLIKEKKIIMLSIDLKPALSYQLLDQRLQREIAANSKKGFKRLLKSLLPQKLIPVFIELTGISEAKQLSQITAGERKKLVQLLKAFNFTLTGFASFDQAIITAGGVSIAEIDPRTMESKLIEGLYFAGEIIDIDADTGGFNLQAAFSTGWLAGRSLYQAGYTY